eukprot:TRINITY_DN18971_c0_g1_i2.p1 TRINITY_DN18971_c0_g1~~TRINITY_DN18971_c0_g1_i2.p1  ORF type:complete len:223 (+),score=32.71 TRINITY_DN18971_c0_g1_i2:91-759(+)
MPHAATVCGLAPVFSAFLEDTPWPIEPNQKRLRLWLQPDEHEDELRLPEGALKASPRCGQTRWLDSYSLPQPPAKRSRQAAQAFSWGPMPSEKEDDEASSPSWARRPRAFASIDSDETVQNEEEGASSSSLARRPRAFASIDSDETVQNEEEGASSPSSALRPRVFASIDSDFSVDSVESERETQSKMVVEEAVSSCKPGQNANACAFTRQSCKGPRFGLRC